MAQRIIQVRVRPARATVLIDREAGREALLLAIEFFSRIWGGRFGQILMVDPKKCDDVTFSCLASSRPEFVYGIGLDDDYWVAATHRACQPRKYDSLRPEFVKNIKHPHDEEYILVDHALIHLMQERVPHRQKNRMLRLVEPEDSSAWSVYCAAMFGIHYPDVQQIYFDQKTSFAGKSVADFVALVTEFVNGWQRSWLDVTAFHLDIRTSLLDFLRTPCPAVVLVDSLLPDFSLFWNLRAARDPIHPASIIPIPFSAANDPEVLCEIKKWLCASVPDDRSSKSCSVLSLSVNENECQKFMSNLAGVLRGTQFSDVHCERMSDQVRAVVPYEYEATHAVEIRGRKLTILPPRPRAFQNLGPSSWYVDLRRSVRSHRAVKELQLPSSPVVRELLNGPCPPTHEHSHIPRVGDGPDCINIRSSGRSEAVNIYLPTSEEVLGELLRELGIEPLHDEKRSSYLPVIKRFGGLYAAAEALSGQTGVILAALANRAMTPDEIRGVCRLGKGGVAFEGYMHRIEATLIYETERMKRICRRRFREYSKNAYVEGSNLQTFLEWWADKSILTRRWKIGPCQRCRQTRHASRLDIQLPIICDNCGHRIKLSSKVPLVYGLQRAVAHAIKEGIASVVRTGRFLRSLTSRGFLWLPGMKYRAGDTGGDIDLVACCDGVLVFAECKTLEATSATAEVWQEVLEQFLETARIAKTCGAELAVLSAQVEAFPEDVVEKIRERLRDSIPYLLLTRCDLDVGHREIEDRGHKRWLGLSDLIRCHPGGPGRTAI